MSMNLSPYISFADSARAALTFYQSIFGGTLTISTFGEYDPDASKEIASMVMHGELETDADFIILASDTPPEMRFTEGAQVSLAIFGNEENTMANYYNALLNAGGTALVPLEKAPWGDSFGMVLDQFGIKWMVNISGTNHGD